MIMATCTNCNAELEEGVTDCPNCATADAPATEAPATESPAEAPVEGGEAPVAEAPAEAPAEGGEV
jgi:hypothetical protein